MPYPEKQYHRQETAKEYTKVYTLEPTDSIVVKQEDDMLAYIAAGQFASTGSNNFIGNQSIDGNLTINGNLNVDNVISASTIYRSGSTKFGDSFDDIHDFTGSVRITGSLDLIGNKTITGSISISGSKVIIGNTSVIGNTTTLGNSTLTGSFLVSGSTTQIGNNTLLGNTLLAGNIGITGTSTLTGSFLVSGSTTQIGNNSLLGNTFLSGSIIISGTVEVGGDIYPTIAQGATLGRPDFPFSALYVQSGSLYIQDDIVTGSYLEIAALSSSLVLKNSIKVISGSRTNFEVTTAGVVSIKAPALPIGTSALSISGDSGSVLSINPGVLVNLTNPLPTVPMRVNLNAVGDTAYSTISAKMARGTLALPTQTLSGDSIFRLSGGTYTNANQYLPGSNVRIDFIANENQTLSNRGSRIDFYTTATGTSTIRRVMSLDNNAVISASVDIQHSVTASLSNEYMWIGDTNNRTKLIHTSSLVNSEKYYLSAYHTESLYTAVENTPYSMSFSSLGFAKGIEISGSDYDKIKVLHPGVYDIQFSAQINKTSAIPSDFYIWLRENGSDVDESNTAIHLAGNTNKAEVASWNFYVSASANTYYQLMYGSDNTNTYIQHNASPAIGPHIPSVILTVGKIG